MIAVATEGLEIRRGDNVALCGVTIQVPLGASVAVVGANGSGKSTLLGALAGLHKPTTGTVETIDDVALVLQTTEIDDGLPITVLDCVKLGRYRSVGLIRRFNEADRRAVRDAIERMGIDSLLDKCLQHLSGGQRQRVLMAQGLAQQSQVLLLDEPMTGLDLTARDLVLNVVAEEVSGDRTVFVATHSLADAAECDLVLLLNTSPVAFGPPDEVLTESNLVQAFGHRVIQFGDRLAVDDHHEH